MSEKGVTVNEAEATGYRHVERWYSDDEILVLFPDGDGSLVNPLLRRAQAAEAELDRLRAERDEAREAAQKICDFAEVSFVLPWLESEVDDG